MGDAPEAGWRAPRWRFHRCLLGGFLLGYLVLGGLTVSHYAPMWDVWEYYIGDKNLAAFTSFDWRYASEPLVDLPIYDAADHPDWHRLLSQYRQGQAEMAAVGIAVQTNDALAAPHLIWPFGPTVSAVSKTIFWWWLPAMDALPAQQFGAILMTAVLLGALFWFVRRRFGLWPAVVMLPVLAFYPRFWAHAHLNVKDVPLAVMFALTAIAVVEGVQRQRWTWLVGGALLWGLALATKANALFVPVVLAPWFLCLLWQRWRAKLGLYRWPIWASLAAYGAIGPLVMLLAWPLLLCDWPAKLLLYLHSLVERGAGEVGGWNAWPAINAVATMPLPVLLLAVAGLGVIVAETWRRRRLRPLHVLVLSWLIVPVLRVSVPGAKDFDVIRHWLEVVPAVAILAGIGGGSGLAWLQRRLRGRSPAMARGMALAALVLWLSPTFAWELRHHPYEMTFYNGLVGGLGGAQARGFPEATDYWASGYRDGGRWIEDAAPPGSRLMVGVAEHIVLATGDTWFERLEQVPVTGQQPWQLVLAAAAHPEAPTWLLYATRREWYHPLVAWLDPAFDSGQEPAPLNASARTDSGTTGVRLEAAEIAPGVWRIVLTRADLPAIAWAVDVEQVREVRIDGGVVQRILRLTAVTGD